MPLGDPLLRTGPWKLYDEKYLFQPTTAYTGKDTQTWLQDLHGYLSGRTADLDRLFKYVESQTEEIKSLNIGFMLDLPATMGEVSRQLWALLGGLVKDHADTKRLFANVPRHNGFEAWQRIAKPINDDKALVRKDLLPVATSPRKATGLDDLPKALKVWETDK